MQAKHLAPTWYTVSGSQAELHRLGMKSLWPHELIPKKALLTFPDARDEKSGASSSPVPCCASRGWEQRLVNLSRLPRASPYPLHVINHQELKFDLKSQYHIESTCATPEMVVTLWECLVFSLGQIKSAHINVTLALFEIFLHEELIKQPSIYVLKAYMALMVCQRSKEEILPSASQHGEHFSWMGLGAAPAPPSPRSALLTSPLPSRMKETPKDSCPPSTDTGPPRIEGPFVSPLGLCLTSSASKGSVSMKMDPIGWLRAITH